MVCRVPCSFLGCCVFLVEPFFNAFSLRQTSAAKQARVNTEGRCQPSSSGACQAMVERNAFYRINPGISSKLVACASILH